MPEELWWSVPVGERGMEKLDVSSFYTLGGAVQVNFVTFAGFDREMVQRAESLVQLQKWLQIFLERSEGTNWKATRERVKQLLALIAPRVNATSPGELYIAAFDTGYEYAVGRALRAFEETFASEAANSTVFSVTQKGTHSTLDLMERAYDNLSPEVQSRLSNETKTDIAEAGRCLALDCYTASGYHILRATERLILKYVDKVTKNVTLKKKPRDWGRYIAVLEAHGGDAKVIGSLQHIKDHYRNPIVHPEDTLGPDDAFSLFNTSISAIIQLDAAIEALP